MVISRTLTAVHQNATDRAVGQTPDLLHPFDKCFYITAAFEGSAVTLEHPVGVDGAGLAVVLCLLLEGVEHPYLLTLDCWLVGEQGGIQNPLLVVTPDLSTDGGCFGVGDGVIPPAYAVDEVVSAVKTQPDLHHAVVITQDRWFLHGRVRSGGDWLLLLQAFWRQDHYTLSDKC